ncbi:phosphohistidine phosphatase SixA [Halomonas sp. NCCP-2165]|nr:phosphohistidine phosphatase SixA [Halomonas sp. NCCP-2165]GKW48450.1 phosphohistidine phosphatase SixA [Halomonas sp. NCCP-2165]
MSERLWIMRHGEAGPGSPDSARELTPRGRREVAAMAEWLKARGIGPCRLVASPYRRARQSAEPIAAALGVALETHDGITPDDAPRAVADWLLFQAEGRPLVLVSHMPLVGALTGLLVEGRGGAGPGFPTAGLAELEAEAWAAGCARLRGFVTPADLAV